MTLKHYLLAAGMALGLAAGAGVYAQQQQTPLEQKLRSAREIIIDEEVVNMGKDYEIFVDRQKVATVSGKNVRLLGSLVGDVFTLTTVDGKVIASEEEDKRWVRYNRAAAFKDAQGNLTGRLAEERMNDLFSVGYIFHFYDKEGKEIGKSKKITRSSLGVHKITDAQGNVDYDVDKKFVLMGGDKYVLKVLDHNSEIPVEHALLLVCIEDAIADAHEAKENKEK